MEKEKKVMNGSRGLMEDAEGKMMIMGIEVPRFSATDWKHIDSCSLWCLFGWLVRWLVG